MFKNWKHIGFAFALVAALFLAACSGSEDSETTEEETDNTDTETNEEVNYSEAVDYTIIGIEPGAGISVTTEAAIGEYDSLQGWEVELSSTGAMMTELNTAISNEEPIIVTGWNPHWMFAAHPDMKYLEDPLEIYGGEEALHTLARQGLNDEKPEAYQVIDQFEWQVEDMEAIMFEAQETGDDIEEIAARWVEENEDRVSAWFEGVDEVDGMEVELVSIPWDSERASSSVLKTAMEQRGFDVTVTDVDVAIVFEALANGDADASLAAWLPITHQAFYESYKNQLEDLGPNLVGAKIGLVVPSYMDINSIEDLEPKQ